MLMTLSTAYVALLSVGLGCMLVQLLVKQKRLEHLFFAIFCGSMAMVATQQLSAATLGPYQYLIGLGTCATCNAMWLISKAMFAGQDSISKNHILFALLISALQMMLTTQVILWWRQYRRIDKRTEPAIFIQSPENETPDLDQPLITGINTLLKIEKGILRPILK
jgi:hypothetical protein